MYDKRIFYDGYRKTFGRIKNQSTVETIDTIIGRAEADRVPLEHLAYMFATAIHESRDRYSAADFSPIMERGSYEYITKQYWHNRRVRGWLGNLSIQDAWDFRGRGLVQITGRTNYGRFNLLENPDAALKINVAVEIMFFGMQKGIFTGASLSRYIGNGRTDYVNARRIINGMDKAEHIAHIARDFEYILKKAA